MQQIIFSENIGKEIDALCTAIQPDRIYLLTDTTTEKLCTPLLADSQTSKDVTHITIRATDVHKNLEMLSLVWNALSTGGASRRSLLINLGGGMVTDLGGFAAATFKRGIDFVNVPTTLLAMIDAAVGGKTGINFNGLKNEIGAFRESCAVVIDTEFLRTLDSENLRSGYAEMLKHSLLETPAMWADHIGFDLFQPDYAHLQTLVSQSISTKQRIVEEDPHEHGIRKALNLGHTVGHAFEALALEQQRPVLHGYAVAWGLLCELFLSTIHCQFPTKEMQQTVRFIRNVYGPFAFTCDDYTHLYDLMRHDKKNVGGEINFTLLGGIGDIRLNQHLTREQVFESFDFFREG